MGCNCSGREKITIEEAALLIGDDRLGYYQHDISALVDCWKKFQKRDKINIEDFSDAMWGLGIDCNYRQVKEFYSKLFENDWVLLKYLVTIAAVLATGDMELKIEYLVKYWGNKETISRESFAEMIDFLFTLVIDFLPCLRYTPNDDLNYSNQAVVMMLSRARAGRSICKLQILNEIFESETERKSKVVQWIKTDKNERWLNARFIRLYLRKAGKGLNSVFQVYSHGTSIINDREDDESVYDTNLSQIDEECNQITYNKIE